VGSRRVFEDDRVSTEKVNGAFTSPPYAEQRKEQYGGVPVDKYVDWWEPVQANVQSVLAADGSFFVNIKPNCNGLDRELYVMDLVIAHVRQWGWHLAEEFCWERSGVPQQVVRRFKNQFEPVYQLALGPWKIRPSNVQHASGNVPIAMGKGKGGDTNAARRQGKCSAVRDNAITPGVAYPGNRISPGVAGEALGHPAAFSVGLPSFFIKAFSDEGDRWLDPFLGSGTTLVACETLGRIGHGIEIAPQYVAVTLERMKGMGLQPELVK